MFWTRLRRWLMDDKDQAILIAAIIEMKELVDWHWERNLNAYGDSQYEELRRLGMRLREELDGNASSDSD